MVELAKPHQPWGVYPEECGKILSSRRTPRSQCIRLVSSVLSLFFFSKVQFILSNAICQSTKNNNNNNKKKTTQKRLISSASTPHTVLLFKERQCGASLVPIVLGILWHLLIILPPWLWMCCQASLSDVAFASCSIGFRVPLPWCTDL